MPCSAKFSISFFFSTEISDFLKQIIIQVILCVLIKSNKLSGKSDISIIHSNKHNFGMLKLMVSFT